ncbi:MAG: peptidoglycan DD-metalloendopeptidase family protein [Anaerolineae bacterium]|nr:peptidoglycan DD-metalloendopeptidase family protein [Anaerolineae bacterium]
MNKQIDSLHDTDLEESTWTLSQIFGRVIARVAALVWRWGNDRHTVVAFVGRYSAHVSIMVLAILVGTMGHITLTPISSAEVSQSSSQRAAAEPVTTSTVVSRAGGIYTWQSTSQMYRAVFRQASPHTEIPERVRLGVITYTVQSGDSISSIAAQFGFSPFTIIWSNMEALQGAPWLIQPGLTLSIPPVDGAYHTVMSGETVEYIAEQYQVDASVLYNEWNGIESGVPLLEGMQLIIPGGIGEDIDLDPPSSDPTAPGVTTAATSWGTCGNVSVSGPGAMGWFVWPTGSTAVSGWYFADPRNPGHIGLDYACNLGDPIYAADNGVIVYAGWAAGYGNHVRIEHGNGYQTYYAHFSSIAVACGQPVYQGQLIGYCGSTGWSTGPHLHYEIRLYGVPQNPRLYE